MTASIFHQITSILIRRKLTVSTMESCTSGLIASLLTDTQGSSEVYRGSFITYCNEAKILCGIPEETIRLYGVYSEETSRAMARTCAEHFQTDIGIGVTGTFGNADPANADSEPGIVYTSVYFLDKMETLRLELPFFETRYEYKMAAAQEIGRRLLQILTD